MKHSSQWAGKVQGRASPSLEGCSKQRASPLAVEQGLIITGHWRIPNERLLQGLTQQNGGQLDTLTLDSESSGLNLVCLLIA